jgi:succinate dehydrogenase hydrophobic anchor subunit
MIGGIVLKENALRIPKPIEERWKAEKGHIDYGRWLYQAFLAVMLCFMSSTHVFAATDMWSKASEIMNSVYSQILGISTIAAVVTASVALLLMNFSKNGRTVDDSRAWLKRIIITWCIINGLGFIMAYVTPFFQGGQYTP